MTTEAMFPSQHTLTRNQEYLSPIYTHQFPEPIIATLHLAAIIIWKGADGGGVHVRSHEI